MDFYFMFIYLKKYLGRDCFLLGIILSIEGRVGGSGGVFVFMKFIDE